MESAARDESRLHTAPGGGHEARTVDVVPRLVARILVRRLLLLLLLRLAGRVPVPRHAERLEQRKRAADPPRIAPVHELVRAPPEPAELHRAALHAHEPPQEALLVDARALRH